MIFRQADVQHEQSHGNRHRRVAEKGDPVQARIILEDLGQEYPDGFSSVDWRGGRRNAEDREPNAGR